jgi:hypothetical protein
MKTFDIFFGILFGLLGAVCFVLVALVYLY